MAMDTVPRVSVLLPLEEGAPRASTAVAGVLAQEGLEVEVLVVHDGSTSDQAAGIAAQDAERVRRLAHPGQGVARALGLGAAVARGEWLVALTGRESWRPGALRAAVEAAEAVAGSVAVLTGMGEEDDLVAALFGDVPPASGGALLRTAAVRAVGGFDPSLRFAHGLDLWLRLLAHGPLLLSPLSTLEEVPPPTLPGEVEPAMSRRERAMVLSQALSDPRPDLFVAGDVAPGVAEARVARAAARSGLAELRPHAIDLFVAAKEAGAKVAPEEEGLLAEAPGLAHVTTVEAVAASDGGEGWLRVALEVSSLDRGGLENVVADLALGFGSAGIEPTVVCTERGGARADELRAAGIPVVVLRGGDRPREMAAVLEQRGIDLLNPHFSTVGVRPAATLGIPVVPTLHNAYAWVGASAVDEFRELDSLVSGYTAVSQFVAEFSSDRFDIEPDRIRVIHNAYRAGGSGRDVDRATARRELGLAEDLELVVQIGRVEPIKCQLAFVDALAALHRDRPRLRGWIIGATGDEAYGLRVAERIERAGLGDAVSLLGQREDVDVLLAAADVLAMPSIVEGLSLSVIEALAAGVPAVLTRTGDAGELLGGAGETDIPGALIDGPRIDPLRVEGEELLRVATADHPPHAGPLAEALVRVLEDRTAMRDRARRRGDELASSFAPEVILAEYADLFGRVVASNGRAAALGLADPTPRVEEREIQGLRRAAVGASDGLEVTLRLAREREQAVRRTEALAYELGAMREDLDGTVRVADQLLNKLRLTHRVRELVASIQRRVRGA